MRLLGTVASQPRNPAAWAPTLLAIPLISGSVTVGNTLTAGNGDWTGWPTSYSYQWQQSVSSVWTNISGATSGTYTTSATGDYRVVVTASNALGTAPAAESGAVTIIASALSTFDPARTGSHFVLSNSNKTVYNYTTGSNLALLEGFKTSGKYWVEIEMGSGSNVEYTSVGVANASVNVNSYSGADVNSKSIVANDTSGAYVWQYGGGSGSVATGKPFNGNGSVMGVLFDNDNRMMFLYVKPTLIPGAWVTADPNTSPTGGIPYEVLGPVAPLYCTYYSGVTATLRIPSEFTESGVCPAGVTMGWYT